MASESPESPRRNEPLLVLDLPGGQVTLLGTAHVSRASADKVRELLETRSFDLVAVELCPSRHRSMFDPDSLSRMDLFEVIRKRQAAMVFASLVLGAYQQRLAEQLGIEPGAEMRAAISTAQAQGLPVALIDREVGTTLRRVYANVPWWRRLVLLSGLLASILSRETVEEDEIERLKEGDILETTFSQFADKARDLYVPLIEERDHYMAARLREELAASGELRVLAVVGAGHLKGIARSLGDGKVDPATTIQTLDRVPEGRGWVRYLPWAVAGLVLLGFAIGFSRSPDLGWTLVAEWVLINGGLSALGAAVAAAHPITVAAAFLAAPLTSLNPTIGAGVVTAAVEIYVRKPRVSDFNSLRHDTTRWQGWRRNTVARTLLVFFFSTLGSAVGTYLAGFRILDHLAGS